MQNSSNIFEQIANAIAAKHLAQVKVMAAKAGTRPSFNELMGQLKQMEQELTKEGVLYIESCKQDQSFNADLITTNLKDIIRATIEGFVRQL